MTKNKENKQLNFFPHLSVEYLPFAYCALCGSNLLVSDVLFLTPGEPCQRFRKICDNCRLNNIFLKE